MPAVTVEIGNGLSRADKVICQEIKMFFRFTVIVGVYDVVFLDAAELFSPVSITVWSHFTPLFISTEREYRRLNLVLGFALITNYAPVV